MTANIASSRSVRCAPEARRPAELVVGEAELTVERLHAARVSAVPVPEMELHPIPK